MQLINKLFIHLQLNPNLQTDMKEMYIQSNVDNFAATISQLCSVKSLDVHDESSLGDSKIIKKNTGIFSYLLTQCLP